MNIDLLTKALKVWQEGPKFNKEDYHASTGLLSNSFIGDFINCEYSAVIKHALKTESGFNQNFAIGHIVEAEIFEGEEGRERMIEVYKNNAISANTGKPYKWLEDTRFFAQSVIRHQKYVDLFRSEGSKYHQSLVFELLGMKWRGEVDYLNINKAAEIDLKTTADMYKKTWNESTRSKETFIESWNYFRQRALYQYGINQLFDVQVTPRILAICKKTQSVRMFRFDDQERLDSEIGLLTPIVDRIKEVIAGEDNPHQCERCALCVESEKPADYEILVSEFCN